MMSQANSSLSSYIRWFHDLRSADVASVGGKNANLGELCHMLKEQEISVPNGFALTSAAYKEFVRFNHLENDISELHFNAKANDLSKLRADGLKIRQKILSSKLPEEIAKDILGAYHRLSGKSVAVRSSATAEDLPTASFAGQQETYLNVVGEDELLKNVINCYASLFTDRAISYRTEKNYDHQKVYLSVGIQEMIRSDLGTSGVAFSLDTESGFRDLVLINASYGLGENIVQGSVNPDEFLVFKPTLLKGYSPIIRRKVGSKEQKLIYDSHKRGAVVNVSVPLDEQKVLSISDEDVLKIAKAVCSIESHYTLKNQKPTPMDIEWAKDGESGKLYIVQARPETVHSQKVNVNELTVFKLLKKGTVLVEGKSVGHSIVTGKARVIEDVSQMDQLQPNEILIAQQTDPDWEPILKKSLAIVTNRGGRTCHAAIVARELGIPAVVGTLKGTQTIKTGQVITVSSAEGDAGYVYEGAVPFEKRTEKLEQIAKTKTQIMMNVAHPEEALRLSMLPNDGVGLARLEFIINSSIGIHPMALVNYPKLKDQDAVEKINSLTFGYQDKKQYFIDQLSTQVGLIAAAFYPKDVIVRMSDFKSNEYAHLIGGKEFEPLEENPMLGFRGAFRYPHPQYQQGFALECAAMKLVREKMGLTNVKLMIPFCRTIKEAKKIIEELAKNNLVQGQNQLEVYMMCEIPSNVILMEEFSELFDGFSIGSNDLTQLTLGIDRDSEIVAPSFDERDPAVLKLLSTAIQAARAKGKKIGICGQAPSDYPEFAEFLVKERINSISLNPDSILKTVSIVRNAEISIKE